MYSVESGSIPSAPSRSDSKAKKSENVLCIM